MKAFLARFNRSSGSRIPPPASIGDAYDIFACLPFELHVLIIAYLEPGDIDAALGASRALRIIWLSEEMWPNIADRWFPGLTQHIRISSIDETARSELFRRTLHRMCKRTEGKFAAAMHYGFGLVSEEFFQLRKDVPVSHGGVHSYESVENLEIRDAQNACRFLIYANGRVVWWPEAFSMPYLAVIDNLRTRERRAYLFPDHDKLDSQGYRTAMGNTLFIMCHETKVHVWHLELNRLESFVVPQRLQRCTTEGETVLMVSLTSDVYIWKFGQGLQHVDVHKLSCYPREYVVLGGQPVWTPRVWRFSQQGLRLKTSQLLLDFILSPTSSDVFVITLDSDNSGELMVHEICGAELVGTYVLEELVYFDPKTTEKGLLKWTKLNSFGGYCLIQVIQEPSVADEVCPCGRQCRELVSVCFNIYTKSFSVLRHHIGGVFTGISHIWNNRLLVMPDPVDTQEITSIRRPVMTLAPCTETDRTQERAVPVPLHTTAHEGVPFVYRRRQLRFDVSELSGGLDIEHGIDVLQEFSPKPMWNDPFIPCPSEISPGRLVGDDEFFLFVCAPSYTVLSFEKDFPTRPPIAEESRSWWRKSRGRIGSLGSPGGSPRPRRSSRRLDLTPCLTDY